MPKRFQGKVELQHSQTKIMRSNLSVDLFIKQSYRLRSKKVNKIRYLYGAQFGWPRRSAERVKLCPREVFPLRASRPTNDMYLSIHISKVAFSNNYFTFKLSKDFLNMDFQTSKAISLHNTLKQVKPRIFISVLYLFYC